MQKQYNRLACASSPSIGPGGWIARIGTFIVAAVMAVLGFMVSLAFFSFIAAVGVIAFIWVWWKTRDLRKQMQQDLDAMNAGFNAAQSSDRSSATQEIFEGEVIRETRH